MNSDNNPNINDKKFEAWFKKHYLKLILGFLFIFSGFPVIAPVLMRFGLLLPAKIIYWAYGFFCHQLPFRSWFLFGAQSYYPLARSGIVSVLSFESVFNLESQDYESLRTIIGNSYAGYKIAICQRDIAMYFSLLVIGLAFAINNRKIKSIPLWIWLMFGVMPLGLDGLTQVLGNNHILFLGNYARESTPLLRTITGGLFGLFSGWYVFPTLELLVNRSNSDHLEP